MNVATLSTNSNDLSQSLGSGWREELSFGDRLWLSLDHYRLAHHFRAQVHGLDMIKFHVRLSGRRLLGFAGAELVTLDTAATAVLLHETDQPKTDHVLAGHEERSVTVAMQRQHFMEYLDASQTSMPSALRDVVQRYACSPRLVTAAPVNDELRMVRELLACPRSGPLRSMLLEAKTLEFVHCILSRMAAPTQSRSAALRLTVRDRQRLHEIRQRLTEDVMTVPRIADLVRESGLNRNKLCAGFRSLFGVSIADYATDVRMQEARRLLCAGKGSVMEVGVDGGVFIGGGLQRGVSAAFRSFPQPMPSSVAMIVTIANVLVRIAQAPTRTVH